jgi:hypothetical protein
LAVTAQDTQEGLLAMSHVVLLGDSIFDNARYVPGEPDVVQQLQAALPAGWTATLCALDGAMTEDVAVQLKGMPAEATHLVVSVGGNDALSAAGILHGSARSAADVFARLAATYDHFCNAYRDMLIDVLRLKKPTALCTVYDAIPTIDRNAVTGLMGFNDCILRESFRAGSPVIDLRLVCTKAGDYSAVSPIEPSAAGGEKIARAIANLVTRHDFTRRQSVIYS